MHIGKATQGAECAAHKLHCALCYVAVVSVCLDYQFADSLLSAKLCDIYRCCVHSEKLLMMDRGTVRNM